MKLVRMLMVISAVAMLILSGSHHTMALEGAHVQFVHLAPSVASVDIYVGDQPVVQGLAYKAVSNPVMVEGAEIKVQIVPAGGMLMNALTSEPITVMLDMAQSSMVVALVGSSANNTLELVPLAGELPSTMQTVGAASAGNIKISGAWARPTAVKSMAGMGDMATPEATTDSMGGMGDMATPEASMGSSEMSMPTSAAYMLIENMGDTDDKLVSVTCDAAKLVQVHQTVIENEVAKMQEVEGGLVVPAKSSVELKPGSYHIMLMQMQRDLVVGDVITVTLTFESGTTLEITVPVKQM